MSYSEIIKRNYDNCTGEPWWTRYAFHYTDVTNAVGILKEGTIYSRLDATRMNLMNNDNASRQVIDMTNSGAVSSVRFYFRPLTPTQYHNEGYKHPDVRYCGDANANVPVPVFFLFDLNKLLCMEETSFSGQSLAGGGGNLGQGEEAFSKLDFSQIYKKGYMENPEAEKKYRQAEISVPESFSIEGLLWHIVCRNEVERLTLLNLLRKEDPKIYSKYKDMILVMNSCFECNGLYVEQCNYFEDKVAIVFSKTARKQQYTQRHKNDTLGQLLLDAEVEFEWTHLRNMISRQSCKFILDYENAEQMTFRGLNKPSGATALYMKTTIDNKLICYMCWQLAEAAMF